MNQAAGSFLNQNCRWSEVCASAVLSCLAGGARSPCRRLRLENAPDEYTGRLDGGFCTMSRCMKDRINHGVRQTMYLGHRVSEMKGSREKKLLSVFMMKTFVL